MNNDTTYTANQDPLEALFASARLAQTNLINDNFTKMLFNSLPTVNLAVPKNSAKKSLSFDLVGAVLGLLMAYLFIDKSSLLTSFVNLIPDSLVISPLLITGIVSTVVLSSVLAWWAVEDNSL